MRPIQHSFSAGEFGEELWGRSDLEQYDLGAKTLHNMEINFGGGAFKRKGTQFGDWLQTPADEIRFIPFRFSNDLASSYLVVMGTGYLRLVKDGGYVLDSAKVVSGIVSGTVSATAHGYVAGDLFYLDSSPNLFYVHTKTDDTFTYKNMFGTTQTTTAGATNARKVFTLVQPYSSAQLREVGYSQYLDVIKFTHPSYTPRLLTRTSTTWTFTEETRNLGAPLAQTPTIEDSNSYIQAIRMTNHGDGYGESSTVSLTGGGGSGFVGHLVLEADDADGDAIAGVTIIKPGTGYTSAPTVEFSATDGDDATAVAVISDRDAGFIVAISAVMPDGRETGITRPAIIRNSIDFTQVKGHATYSWTAVTEALYYNVYRSLVVPEGLKMHIGMPMGFIGTSRGTSFEDANITPDFTRTPTFYRDPFAPGAVESIRVTAAGSGYATGDTLTLTGSPGTGFVGYPIVQDSAIIGVYIANPGSGYVAPELTVTTSGGSAATFAIVLTPATGTYPSVSFRFQQRYGYAGTTNEPMTLWATQPNYFTFNESEFVTAANPYTYTLDAEEVTPILHAIPVKFGLLLFTALGVSLLRASEGNTVTPLSGFVDPQSFIGSTRLRPAVIHEDIVYVQPKERSVQMLFVEGTSRQYQGREISILARHLFDGREITSLAFTYAQDKRGYGVWEDGYAFSATISREQNQYAFGRTSMQGKIRDVASLSAGQDEHIYFQVERVVNGTTMKSFEMMLPEPSQEIEDCIYLDGTVSTAKVYPAANITVSGTSGEQTVTASSSLFSSGDVGKILGLGGGRGVITSRSSSTQVEVNFTRPITKLAPESVLPAPALSGEWWMNSLVSTVSNIPWEGATVDVIADGKLMNQKVVTNGAITLDFDAAIVHVGFGYSAYLTTLPLTDSREVIEGRRMKTNAVRVKFRRAGAFLVGDYLAAMRTDEAWFEPTGIKKGERWVSQTSGWEPNGEVTITAPVGLPLEILQVVHDVSVGA
jgi:hypothetical protein